jgi:ankyrin repeat protein
MSHSCGAAPETSLQSDISLTPHDLDRCQSQSGGTKVAELLLAACPDLLDEIDHFGKTALYMACEKGNEKMVHFLLAAQANPNIDGPGKCTPLVTAIESASHAARKLTIVSLLLENGADPRISDANGRTAFAAASNTGLAGSEIKKLLGLASPQRRISSASVTSTMRRSISSQTVESTRSQRSVR